MAKYYYCNASTKKELPCQNHVKKESDRCWIHDGSSGPDFLFKNILYGLNGIILTHASYEAIIFSAGLIRKLIDTIPSLSFLSSQQEMGQELLEKIISEFANNQDIIISQLLSFNEDQIFELCSFLNPVIQFSLLETEQTEQQEDKNLRSREL